MFLLDEHPHRRYNPLTQSWVLVSPHRSKRPWQGQMEKKPAENALAHDPDCYLCAGNVRANGEVNPNYKNTFVFQNDFAALLEDTPEGSYSDGDLFQAKSERGECHVICFSPTHHLTIPEMSVADIRKVVDVWCKLYKEIGRKENVNYIQIFENKGAMMGCSNPHPHGQIWAQSTVPDEPAKKTTAQLAYWKKNKRSLLQDYVEKELVKKDRILFENAHFVGLVPFWATWPFETMLISKRHVARITDLTSEEKTALADAYRQLTIRYDNLFEVSFPYSAGIHQAPTDGKRHAEWHLHLSFYPPLLRSATVRKFMVGYEMLANPQRDITPEKAAAVLKGVSEVYYKH